MTDISPKYRRLAKHLNKSRKTLSQACNELDIDIDDIEDDILAHYVSECSHCDIWGTTHRLDEDNFPVCSLCLKLVGA